MRERYELTPNMSLFLTTEDADGYICLLERWHSIDGEWLTGVTVYRPDGSTMMHAGRTTCKVTDEEALAQIRCARIVDESLRDYEERRAEA